MAHAKRARGLDVKLLKQAAQPPQELIEKMVRGRGAGRRSPEESVRLLAQRLGSSGLGEGLIVQGRFRV